MAFAFTGTTHNIRATTFAAPSTTTGTIAIRILPGWAHNDSATHVFWYISPSGGGANAVSFQKFSDNNVYIGWNATGGDDRIVVAADAAMFTNGTLASHIFTWDNAADDQKYYVNGTQKGTRTTTLDTGTITGQYTIGNYPTTPGQVNCNATLSDYAEWTVVLDAGERAAYGAGYSPLTIRPSALQVYMPLVRNGAVDMVGATAFTVSNAAAAAHPRIIFPYAPAMIGHNIGDGGGGGFQAAWARGANTVLGTGIR
jgi:hypothetical protein